ncbi:glycoside hydrolase family 32 protein [Quadrisphaera setariae]|uniref:beta-fructofuranosidase n=1 Tax=Quadrisphaera setariae TaxID=2593304 RepID=A0A5C8Z434_9ACTN|nr:glycoside hydrolase family 32 protein [Quadrisphaera setariae]TXR52852.1 glycoside hydrolase family 32 protein [Quadrisphaera setariae]
MSDHLTPRFHIRPPRGFLNDPNGPVQVGGTTHLYFQNRPTLDMASPVQWGHATSTDLVRWQLHRPAMVSTPDGPDRDGVYSGNTVIDTDGNVRAFYSGHVRELPFQSVLTAVSTDGGASFGAPELAVADPAPEEGVLMFRDPFVWHDGERWQMVVGSERAGQVAAVRRYDSDDLTDWTYRGEWMHRRRSLTTDGHDTGSGWECPQVVTVDGIDSVLVAAWAQTFLSGRVLVLDDAPGGVDHPYPVDHGTSFYAPSIMRDSPAGPLVFGWLKETIETDEWAERGWAGVISLPRVLSRGDDGTLRSAPLPAVDVLRAGDAQDADGALLDTTCFELELPMTSATTRLCFGAGEEVVITVDLEADTVTLDHDGASLDHRAHRGVVTAPDALAGSTRPWAARVFVDGSVIEVFTAAGRALTARVYPTTPPPWKVQSVVGARLWHLR